MTASSTITITPVRDGDGALVSFPKDRALIDSLKKAFPKARWNPVRVAWHVPGKTAVKRLEQWKDGLDAERQQAASALQKAADALAFEPIDSRLVGKSFDRTTLWVKCAYHERIVALLRSIPDCRWNPDHKEWRLPATSAEQLRAVLPEIERLHAEVTAAREAERRERQRQHEAYLAAERAAREQQRAERVAHRHLYPLAKLPRIGVPVRAYGQVVVYTGTGKTFRIGEDDPSAWGSHLLGYEGEMACFAYFREATPEEIAQIEADEAERKAREQAEAERKRRLSALVARAQAEGERPAGDHVLQGERLLDTQDIYGGGDWWVISEDAVWYVRNNGHDGDDWSRNNVRTGAAGAIGWRLPRDAEMERELRELATSMPRQPARL